MAATSMGLQQMNRQKSSVLKNALPDAAGAAQSLSTDEIKAEVKRIVPPFTSDSYKGAQGVLGILGGCVEYTGAPYFTAMACLKV